MARLRFDRFSLDPDDRLLRQDDRPVDLNARYLDALILLAREPGRLISKERFLAEIWRGVPVTDEALTQCIKTLRRQLGDDAGSPRFIETVPKHGYRFIATVELEEAAAAAPAPALAAALAPAPAPAAQDAARFVRLGLAGTLGAAAAGLAGGLLYGFAGAAQALQPGMGALSVLVVLASLTLLVALLGGAGVAFGIAAAELAGSRRQLWQVLGGAGGGLVVGAFGKLLGLDAFALLFGQSPGNITGGPEGAALGAAVGLGAVLAASVERKLGPRIAIAAAMTAAGGMLIALAGGRLMGGSLALLAGAFPSSRLRFDQLGSLFGEAGFGPLTQIVTGGLEGLLFGAGIVGAMLWASRKLGRER